MAKFHVNAQGLPGVCKALSQASCPFGGTQFHFDTIEETQAFAERVTEKEWILEKSTIEERTEMLKSSSDKDFLYLSGVRGNDKTNLTEIKSIRSFLEVKEDDLPIIRSVLPNNKYSTEEDKAYATMVRELVMPDTKSNNSIGAIWEDQDYYTIWPNNSNYLDCITYRKSDGRITNMECKDLTEGAQIKSINVQQGADGRIKLEDKSYYTDSIKNQIESWDPVADENLYKNFDLELSDEDALKYFIAIHKEENCTKFSFQLAKEDRIKRLYLTEDDSVNINRFKEANIKVKLRVRNNNPQNYRKPNKKDLERYDNQYGKFFKDGVAKREFTWSDLDHTKRKKDGNNIRIGEYRTTITNDWKPKDHVFKIEDFKFLKPHITGEIREG